MTKEELITLAIKCGANAIRASATDDSVYIFMTEAAIEKLAKVVTKKEPNMEDGRFLEINNG